MAAPEYARKYFHRRIRCVERLVDQIAEQVHGVAPKAIIKAERSIDPRPPAANLLTVSVNDERFVVRDLWPQRLPTAEGTDRDNLAFIKAMAPVASGLRDTILKQWPSLAEGMERPFTRFEINIGDSCRNSLDVARRAERWVSRPWCDLRNDPEYEAYRRFYS